MESFFHRDQLSQSCLGWKWAGNGNLESQIARCKVLIKWFIQSCKWMFISCNVHSTVGMVHSFKGGQDINWYIHTHSYWEVQAECSRRSEKAGVTSDYGNQEGRLGLVRWKVRKRVFQLKGTKVETPTAFEERKSPSLCVGRNRTGKYKRRPEASLRSITTWTTFGGWGYRSDRTKMVFLSSLGPSGIRWVTVGR